MTIERPAMLELKEVTRIYGSGETSVVAVDGVDAVVRKGEFVALLGPSGCGKTTLLLMAGLLDTPTRGEVWIGGRRATGPRSEVGNLRDFRRNTIGFVFQKPNLIPFLTAEENVRIGLHINDVPRPRAQARALELLDYLGVLRRARNYPKQLSGGEQQRIAIARALANRPAIILADEPTAALDSIRGRQVFKLFKRVAGEMGTAIITVTHDHRHLDLIDRVLEMSDGHLIEAPVRN